MQRLKACNAKGNGLKKGRQIFEIYFPISLAFWHILRYAKSMCIIMHVHWQNDAAADNKARHQIYGKCNTAAINWMQDKAQGKAVVGWAWSCCFLLLLQLGISSESENQEKYWMQFYLPHTTDTQGLQQRLQQLQPQNVLRWGYRNISYCLWVYVCECVFVLVTVLLSVCFCLHKKEIEWTSSSL